jgi:DNA polymerase eta
MVRGCRGLATDTYYTIGYSSTKSKQTAFPFVRDLKIDHIANAGNQLWNSLAGSSSTQLNVTNLQLSFTGLEFEHGQSKLEGFFSSDTPAGPANSDCKLD